MLTLPAPFTPLRLLLVALLALAGLVAGPPSRAVAEDLRVPSPRVGEALDLLSLTPATQELRATLEANGVVVRFLRMAPGVYARYSVARRSIEIDDRWAEADAATLATVIVHEAVHAQDAVSGYLASGGASACIDSELRAFRAGAVFWTAVHGPAGKASPADELERQLNLIADRAGRDPAGFEQIVRQAYTDQCSPGQ